MARLWTNLRSLARMDTEPWSALVRAPARTHDHRGASARAQRSRRVPVAQRELDRAERVDDRYVVRNFAVRVRADQRANNPQDLDLGPREVGQKARIDVGDQ